MSDWLEGCALIVSNGIEQEITTKSRRIYILKSHHVVIFESAYEDDYSDATPGQGIMPPICTILTKRQYAVYVERGL